MAWTVALKGVALFTLIFSQQPVFGTETAAFKKQETGLYPDVFNQNFYYEGTNLLHLDRLYRYLFRRDVHAANVNVFDEVPDSSFFSNRHARKRLSTQELKDGPKETDGPDLSDKMTITSGKFEGLHPGFFVQDRKGDKYLLKFDDIDSFELVTAAEVIASRFYHAIGYNVPQYTISVFSPEKLVPGEGAKVYDDSGFKRDLTQSRLEEYLLFVPQNEDGNYRASASKILAGKNKGSMRFKGRRKNDPEDPVDHQRRREIRALPVFASWLNNYDVRESNTLEMLVEENGRQTLKHYFIDFNSTLGGGSAKPMFTHEHMIDYGEAFKAFLALGLWEKPWQKRWKETGEKITKSPAVGYFDNRYFDPGDFKTQLPYFAFKDMTRADGFWAAKIIMSFTDEDIQAVVQTGAYSDPSDAAEVARVLIERRDLIGRYWFDQATPLTDFESDNNQLQFKDLAVENGFRDAQTTTYKVDVIGRKGSKRKQITSLTSGTASIPLDAGWWSQYEQIDLLIRAVRGSSKPNPYVLVELDSQGVAGVLHED